MSVFYTFIVDRIQLNTSYFWYSLVPLKMVLYLYILVLKYVCRSYLASIATMGFIAALTLSIDNNKKRIVECSN